MKINTRKIALEAERKSLIYDFDKVKPENLQRYNQIQEELNILESIQDTFKRNEKTLKILG
mgnify:CR=1 FL=1